MSRTTIVGGRILETTGGDFNIYAKENIVYSSATTITETGVEKGVNYGNPENPPERKNYFTKGWWSLDLEGTKIIKSAIPFMTVYFHLETKNIPNGGNVFMSLYEEDNSEAEENDGTSGDKDDKITLVNKATMLETQVRPVNNNKVVIPIELGGLGSFLENEADKVLELYFRCSYSNENSQYPTNKEDYLKVSEIVADRYKMPGLNEDGKDIASDLSFGFGVKGPNPIYNSGDVTSYIDQYTEKGFQDAEHALFVNNTSNANANDKAKYSREECYNAKYTLTTVPFIDLDLNISTGLDVRIFDNFSDDRLFWNFEQTASLYFATGLLEGNLRRMIAKFKANQGGIYEDAVLNQAIVNSDVTKKYCADVEKYLSESIKANITSLDKIEDKKPYFGNFNALQTDRKNKNKTFSRPIYNVNKTEGLTIALNDIWATQIVIKELKNTNTTYKCKYEVILWDHFGLDLPDMEKVFNIIPSVGETFVTWFILQHLRGYKPFVTKIKFEKEFEGTF